MHKLLDAILVFFLFFISACTPPIVGKPGAHEGYNLQVWIDGNRTVPLTNPTFKGESFFNKVSSEGLWHVDETVSSLPKFRYDIDQDSIGRFVEAKATIEQANSSPGHSWEMYYSNLSSATSEFEPGYEVQSEHFQTAENDDILSNLPSGTYLVRLFVYGTKDWDSQAIFVNIQ